MKKTYDIIDSNDNTWNRITPIPMICEACLYNDGKPPYFDHVLLVRVVDISSPTVFAL